MNGWGATCGIPIAVAMVIQQAVPDGRRLRISSTSSSRTTVQAVHPQTDVSNAAWFYNGVTEFVPVRSPACAEAVKVGSMQCHNAVEQYIKLGNTFSPGRCARSGVDALPPISAISR
jgi:hypothetical protein